MPAAWAAGISAVGSIAGGLLSSGAVSGASGEANRISQETIDKVTGLYQPYMTTGTTANTQIGNLLGLGGQDAATAAMGTFQASPGYGYQVSEGIRAVDAGAASKGLLHSGNTIKAEETLGSNLANQDYGNYLARLNALASSGLSATSGLANVMSGQSTSQQNTLTSGATQQASIYGNTANAITGAVGTAYKNNLFGGSAFGGAGSTTLAFS